MTDSDFVYVKGPGMRRLTPRTRRGWTQFGAMMALTLALALGPVIAAPQRPVFALAGAGIGVLLLLVFLRAAAARAQVIDLATMTDEWDEFQAWRARGRR